MAQAPTCEPKGPVYRREWLRRVVVRRADWFTELPRYPGLYPAAVWIVDDDTAEVGYDRVWALLTKPPPAHALGTTGRAWLDLWPVSDATRVWIGVGFGTARVRYVDPALAEPAASQ